jgi:hypothetical protein
MSERKHDQKVKELSVDDDCLTIELLSGLRLTGPLRSRPIYRDPVVQSDSRSMQSETRSMQTDTRSMQGGDFSQPLSAT